VRLLRFTLRLVLLLTGFTSLFSCEPEVKVLFQELPPDQTGITFSNDLKEEPAFNIIEYLYFYNGGGVAIGDINRDGLPDIYFSGNQVENKLYINKGNFEFEDITQKAGVAGIGNWKTGVSMVDINGDGWLDIYVCGVGGYKKFNSRNQLLVNNGDLTFTDRTDEFGMDFQGLSTQAAFLDYDRDGDLDCFLVNHSVHSTESYRKVSERNTADTLGGDRLLRNDFILEGKLTGHVKFTDVTSASGILSSQLGYGLGVAVSDLNLDGYPDLYVSNDFWENDYLYMNQRDGTFRQVLEKSMAHTSRFSMGSDIADINNDGLPDIITLDMLPRDESVIKTSAGEDPMEIYKFKQTYGFHRQVSRNCLQINQFVTDSSVFFSDGAFMYGVAATDWSWAPLFADFDNDRYRDLYISNGIMRRPNDMDYISYIADGNVQDSLEYMTQEDLRIIQSMPSGIVPDYFFRNTDSAFFEDVTLKWGMGRLALSNGAAYADLDNDGDLDLVVNHLNEPAGILQNHADKLLKNNYIRLNLKGTSANSSAIGARVEVYHDEKKITYEHYTVRGFCSSVDPVITIGLGDWKSLDSIKIIWPMGNTQVIKSPEINIRIDVQEISGPPAPNVSEKINTWLSLLPMNQTPDFSHEENDYNAFNSESLIPHALTNEGPALATGDIDNDGDDDAFFGGARNQSAVIYKNENGTWRRTNIDLLNHDRGFEDVDAVFFDADQDKDMDLIVVSGGQENVSRDLLKPRLYLNDGRGNFATSPNAFNKLFLNASCVKPFDYDLDGDQDLFIGASVIPNLYGMSPSSYLLENNGRGVFSILPDWLGNSTFDNVTRVKPGMVKDAVWSDVNKDGMPDLILVGTWMPLTVLIQQPDHKFKNQTRQFGLMDTRGWWNTIMALDIDHDGDDDFVAGNLGLNSRVTATRQRPLSLYLGDFDSNGSSDHILVYYNGGEAYPFVTRDQLVKQIPSMKKKFLHYRDYRNVNLQDIISPAQEGNSSILQADEFRSMIIINDQNKLRLKPLPSEVQLFPVYSILVDDFNQDGVNDLILAGNFIDVQPELGPYDAGYGIILKGNPDGTFLPVGRGESGLLINGSVRGIQKVIVAADSKTLLVARNNQPALAYRVNFIQKK
jgi:hypothetical protein